MQAGPLKKAGAYLTLGVERRNMLEFICPACGQFSLEEAMACASCSGGRVADASATVAAE